MMLFVNRLSSRSYVSLLANDLLAPVSHESKYLAAISAVAPAFEVVDMRVNMAEDMPLGVADGIAQWGYVTGTALSPIQPILISVP